MDFYRIVVDVQKDGTLLIFPDWQVDNSEDLMVQGSTFYAFWDENRQVWSRDAFRLRQLIDISLWDFVKKEIQPDVPYRVLTTQSFATGMWKKFNDFVKNFPDNYHPLDTKLTFANDEVKKSDYVSKRLPYSMEEGSTAAWDELIGILYSEEERDKIEWAIGSVFTGASKSLQKFFVFYGPPASGKSTVLNIVQDLFQGYVTSFDAKALGSAGNTFATDVFKSNPLVAVQHDGDLSRIENNARLNSITSHEEMTMNEKYKASYTAKVLALLLMGTNKPVQITDAKAGTIRRLIDVHPTGARVAAERYHILLEQIGFELGAIAYKCATKFKKMGRHYYDNYKPEKMMYQTDEFYNYISHYFDIFKAEDGVTLKRAWDLYKEYCNEFNITRLMKYSLFREELNSYFSTFEERTKVNGEWMRSYYSGFEGIPQSTPFVPDTSYVIDLKEVDRIYSDHESIFDRINAEQPAQYANEDGEPSYKWVNVRTTLADIDSSKLHFVQIPKQHIVIDFDLVDEDGQKDIQRNIEAASKWPATYAEVSKSGHGIHLHYFYNGDVEELANVYDVGIEVKTLLGGQSLRRRLTKCNTLDISTITGGLPLKEKKNMLNEKSIQSEKALRDLIMRNLRKEIHPGTKPSIDFIEYILNEAYENDLSYDVSDLHPKILAFAAGSTNQAQKCIMTVKGMRFKGKLEMANTDGPDNAPLVVYDVEVYPNLFVVCWKYVGGESVVRMINPTPSEIEALFKLRLVGFNNRRYDNHILYARYMGYSNSELFLLSQKIVEHNDKNCLFKEAYNLSYADIYDFSSKKQGLKKFMIELGITHMEMDIPWDEPVPQELWENVLKYCENDVLGTEAVLADRHQDLVARQILAEISGLTVNDTTQRHTAQIIFGADREPQKQFVYTDLSEEFPGYTYDGAAGSMYRGEKTGEGGYVYAEPGIYDNVALLDVASMHPTSAINLNLFGPYTGNFKALMDARLAIKHGDFERARSKDILDGRLGKFLDGAEDDPAGASQLAYALKIVINIVYGLTSASFPNPFRDTRNKDNIVAKRGALFMIDLKNEVQKRGFTVVHIKTDSIKIANPTPEIIEFVFEFGRKYGYDFEHEATYEKFCLVNDAVYIARSGDKWTAVGKQFQHPYVYKSLFSKEPIEFDDFCEVRNVVQGTMYLDVDGAENVADMVHLGRTGSFVPVMHGGGTLWRVKDDNKYAVTGTKGYRWITREVAKSRKDEDLIVDMSYFEHLANDALKAIEKFGSYEELVA
ncbi:hypothetical protein KC887_02345 [Candidatus Kaiserbacteria bacterium]|nr:hypothetical protein [Candidatus Kaiserbacteria bacterium]